MFQDGLVAQGVNYVTSHGATYFSAAGNDGPDSGYLSTFRASSGNVNGIGQGTFMNFDPAGGTNLLLPIETTVSNANITFEYDQPYKTQEPAGSTATVSSVVYFYVLDSQGNIVASGTCNNVAMQEPLQEVTVPDAGYYSVAIQVVSGPNPNHVEFVGFNDSGTAMFVNPIYGNAGGTSYPTTFGHAAAASTIGVGATPWWAPSPYIGQDPLFSEPFSSTGPALIDLSPKGTPIPAQIVQNPTITAPDGGTTSFFIPGNYIDTTNPPFYGEPASSTNLVPAEQQSLPSFFGTSSAAPNAAAVAALMLQTVPTLNRVQIRADLIASAQPMNGAEGDLGPRGGIRTDQCRDRAQHAGPTRGIPDQHGGRCIVNLIGLRAGGDPDGHSPAGLLGRIGASDR